MFTAKDLMTTNVISVKKRTPIYDAIRTMVENNITGVPVVNDDMTLAGIISEKDVLQLLYDCKDLEKRDGGIGKVEDFMTKDVVTFDKDENLLSICNCLMKRHFRRVPVLSDGKLAGIITRKDLIKYILEPIG
jgi:CBS domain-containing protein